MAKIGEGHVAAMGRLGLKELRNALYKRRVVWGSRPHRRWEGASAGSVRVGCGRPKWLVKRVAHHAR